MDDVSGVLIDLRSTCAWSVRHRSSSRPTRLEMDFDHRRTYGKDAEKTRSRPPTFELTTADRPWWLL
jgi:hypothetical protein